MRTNPILLSLLVLAGGCATPTRQPAVPEEWTTDAEVPGFPGIRYRPQIDIEPWRLEAGAALEREVALLGGADADGLLPPAVGLAISGGGDKGAFGAGLLVGWTAAGTRPEFKLVTGVSTGALIAPFAFLGPAYDADLQRFYTEISPDDVVHKRSILAIVTSDAMMDNQPLKDTLETIVDRSFLDEIAAEYEKGRLLMIGTVDIDSRQAVVWNMTRIASFPGEEAVQLFRDVMVASAAIPGAFPPTLIDVEVDGEEYQEMHVDGGTLAQVFVYPSSHKVKEEVKNATGLDRERTVYVIRNARLDAEWGSTDRRTMTGGP
jgi:predicted acylesterase/phospholipase RssA